MLSPKKFFAWYIRTLYATCIIRTSVWQKKLHLLTNYICTSYTRMYYSCMQSVCCPYTTGSFELHFSTLGDFRALWSELWSFYRVKWRHAIVNAIFFCFMTLLCTQTNTEFDMAKPSLLVGVLFYLLLLQAKHLVCGVTFGFCILLFIFYQFEF